MQSKFRRAKRIANGQQNPMPNSTKIANGTDLTTIQRNHSNKAKKDNRHKSR